MLHFNINSVSNDVMNNNSTGWVDQQVGVDVDCKITVKPFISAMKSFA